MNVLTVKFHNVVRLVKFTDKLHLKWEISTNSERSRATREYKRKLLTQAELFDHPQRLDSIHH